MPTVKRTQHISLVLSGALAMGVHSGCDSHSAQSPPTDWVSEDNTYTNNHYVSANGYHAYYHAPYRAWFPLPYNYYSPNQGYYHGGNWTPQPNQSPITASKPISTAARSINSKAGSSSSARSKSGSISRGGFGHSSHSSSSS